MADEAVRARLAAIAPVAALVGDRIRPLKLEQATTYPVVMFRRVSAQPVSTMGEDAALTGTVYEVESWAETHAAAIDLARKVRAGLARWGGIAGGVTVQQVFFQNEIHFYDPELRVHRVSQDYAVWYEEE
jgi:hypothetical protein